MLHRDKIREFLPKTARSEAAAPSPSCSVASASRTRDPPGPHSQALFLLRGKGFYPGIPPRWLRDRHRCHVRISAGRKAGRGPSGPPGSGSRSRLDPGGICPTFPELLRERIPPKPSRGWTTNPGPAVAPFGLRSAPGSQQLSKGTTRGKTTENPRSRQALPPPHQHSSSPSASRIPARIRGPAAPAPLRASRGSTW